MSVRINKKECLSCGGCVSVCPVSALSMGDKFPTCDKEKCTNCKTCINFCPVGAIMLGE